MTAVLTERTAVFLRDDRGIDFHDNCPLREHCSDLMASLLSSPQRTAVLNLMTSVLSENTEVLNLTTAVFSSDSRGLLQEHRGVELHDCCVLQR